MKQIAQTLNEFTERHSISKQNAKAFCRLAYDMEAEGAYGHYWERPPKLRIIDLPIKNNGSVHYAFVKNLQRVTVVINLYHLLREKKWSDQLKYAFLYATIVHELEHIKLLRLLEQHTEPDYFEVISAWDQVVQHRGMTTNAVADFLMPSRRKVSEKRTAISPAEIYCNRKAFARAYDIFKEDLTEEDQKIILQMIDSLEFISKNLEISYDSKGRAIGLFANTLKQMCTYSRYSKMAATHLPMMECLLNQEGQLISAAEMMNKSQLPEQNFYDEVLIRMFIFGDTDWNKQFDRTAGLKDRICALANAYCQQCIQYLLNQEKLKVLMSDEMIQDNSAMLIKSIHILKRKMKQYEMENTVGGIFPMYGI